MFTSGTLLPLSIPESDISKYSVFKTQLLFDITVTALIEHQKIEGTSCRSRGDLQPCYSNGET